MKPGIVYWFWSPSSSHRPTELDILIAEQQTAKPHVHPKKGERVSMLYKFLFFLILVILPLLGVKLYEAQGAETTTPPNPQTAPSGNTEGWQVQTVATRGNAGSNSDIVLDASGYPHISYYEHVHFLSGTDEQLHYAYWDGIRWHRELVIENLLYNTELNPPTSIDLDSNGSPHIVYVDNGNLYYAVRNEGVWEIETVDDSIETISEASFQLDTNDTPHISYQKAYDLAYAVKIETTWHTEMIETNTTGYFNSLAIGANNLPQISYTDSPAYVLKLASYDGTSWLIQTVDDSEPISGPTSLDLTSLGSPRIAYVASSGNLKYAFWTGKNWATESVTTLPNTNVYVALALDLTDSPRIVYSGKYTDIPLTYLRRTEIWLSEPLDLSATQSHFHGGLAVDADGDIHVSYYEDDYYDLRYVTWDPNWITRTVHAPGAIQATSLQLLDGNPHISHFDTLSSEVKLVGWQSGWADVSLPLNPLLSGQVDQTSLAFTSSKTHMSYSTGGNLYYLVWDGQDWDVQIVGTNATAGEYNQLLVVGNTAARIAYWDEGSYRVKLAELTEENTWEIHTNTVGPALDQNSGYLSATILPQGKIGISYYDGIQGDLRLAVWDPETDLWTDELIDGDSPYTGLLSAIQTDGTTGSPAVAYYSAIGGNIYFAYQDGETWHSEPAVIEAGSVTSIFLELGMNSLSRPRIAFTNNMGALAVASKQDDSWVVETVVSGSPTLDNVSMAISDRPHLAFTDFGLYYAFRSATLDVDSFLPGPPVIAGGTYNPMDACQAVLELYIEGNGLMAQPREASLGNAGPLADEAIFMAMNMLFATSPGGDYYIDLYGQHGSEMGQIALDDPQLLWDAYGTLQNFLPGLEALVQGEGNEYLITQTMVDDALNIWQRTAAVSSPDLANVINSELARYNNLQDFVGLSFAEWLETLGVAAPDPSIYLPIVTNAP